MYNVEVSAHDNTVKEICFTFNGKEAYCLIFKFEIQLRFRLLFCCVYATVPFYFLVFGVG